MPQDREHQKLEEKTVDSQEREKRACPLCDGLGYDPFISEFFLDCRDCKGKGYLEEGEVAESFIQIIRQGNFTVTSI